VCPPRHASTSSATSSGEHIIIIISEVSIPQACYSRRCILRILMSMSKIFSSWLSTTSTDGFLALSSPARHFLSWYWNRPLSTLLCASAAAEEPRLDNDRLDYAAKRLIMIENDRNLLYVINVINVHVYQAKRPGRQALVLRHYQTSGERLPMETDKRTLPAKRASLRDLLNPRTMELCRCRSTRLTDGLRRRECIRRCT
jgi:hypothetical protein